MKEKPTRPMWEVLGATHPQRPPTEEEKLAGLKGFYAVIKRMKADLDQLRASPEWRAMEKLEAGIAALLADPEISVNEGCKDLLEMIQELLDRAWPHHSAGEIIAPTRAHFNAIARDAWLEKRKQEVEVFRQYLDTQTDMSNTKLLAKRLRGQFPNETERSSEDAVRAWKKLRRAGDTEKTTSQAPPKAGSGQ